MVKEGAEAGMIQGILLPVEGRQQIISQYADDISFTLLGKEGPTRNLINCLGLFCRGSSLVLNWQKSWGYWKHGKGARHPRPNWTNRLGVTWVDNGDISKLLGTPFGLDMTSNDVNEFLLAKVRKKLLHWCQAKVNVTGRGVVVNSVLLSSMFFFLVIWGGTKAGVKKVRIPTQNYF